VASVNSPLAATTAGTHTVSSLPRTDATSAGTLTGYFPRPPVVAYNYFFSFYFPLAN